MVSCICTTYRRYRCIERIIAMWQKQTYKDSELIIFNTDDENPMSLDESLKNENIIVINNHIDYETNKPYENTGAIRRDCVTHAKGDYFMLWDDDDLYLDFNLQQAVEQIELSGKKAWKPRDSFFRMTHKLEFCRNTMEASVIVKMDAIREIGFRYDSGYESLSWYSKLRDEKELNEFEKEYIPAYCFNWGDTDGMSDHKQSGDINNPENFENHKKASQDIGGEPLKPMGDEELEKTLKPLYDLIHKEKNTLSKKLYERYCL